MLDTNGTPISSTDESIELKAVEDINSFTPDFLFVGISHPRQEKWVYRWQNKLNVKGFMVVGGTFRYVSGKTLLPPKFVNDIGLEWLWRLFSGSQTISRIITAVIRFPLAVFRYKLSMGS